MALLPPINGARLTQGFGPSALGVEPAMWADAQKAWWHSFPGSKFYQDFHAALDLAAPLGTPILASEAGTVIESYFDSTNGGGNKVRVQIRPGVSYCHNHMQSRAVAVGTKVKRGQVIGTVGSTGWSTGPHSHFWVGIDDEIGSQTWPTLMNPTLFLPGGALADDPRIKPEKVIRYVVLNGAGINIRKSPTLEQGSANIYATSRPDGIYRNGEWKWPLGKKMRFVRWVDGSGIRWAKVYLGSGYRYVAKSLVHFV